MILFSNTRHCNKNGSIFHATTITGMMGEVNNNSFDRSSLGFVDSHGKGKIKGKWEALTT